MPKYVAMAFHPWTHLEASAHLGRGQGQGGGRPLPWTGNLLPMPIRPGKGMGIGFLPVYDSRVEAETANPGVEVLEIEESQR